LFCTNVPKKIPEGTVEPSTNFSREIPCDFEENSCCIEKNSYNIEEKLLRFFAFACLLSYVLIGRLVAGPARKS
jgi:hypothetical protein